MRFSSPIVLGSLLLVFSACKDGNNDTSTGDTEITTTTASDTTAQQVTSTTQDPTSSTSTGEPVTTSTGGTTDASSTTGVAATHCVDYDNENACEFDDACNWAKVFQYTHGNTGCQGDVVDFCVDAKMDVPSTWYRGEGSDVQVVQFSYTPDDLPPEWKLCDCDGPLACFCTAPAPECPERLDEFCGATTSKLACTGSAINAEFRCGWFRIWPEGPLDDTCSQQPFKDLCLPADNAGSMECTLGAPDYAMCAAPVEPPGYWRVVDGEVQVTEACGPVPPSPEWTPCDLVDTPEQPDECGCLCGVMNP